jgi:hypothetical protein
MFSNVLPRRAEFFDRLDDLAQLLGTAGERLLLMVQRFDDLTGRAREIKGFEVAGDVITAEIYRLLAACSDPPMPADDMHRLAASIDSVLDGIEAVAFRISAFRLDRATEPCRNITSILCEACTLTASSVRLCRSQARSPEMSGTLHEIALRENEVDDLYRDAERRLFCEPTDAVELIKWKDVYGRLENTADCCRRVADVILGIRNRPVL